MTPNDRRTKRAAQPDSSSGTPQREAPTEGQEASRTFLDDLLNRFQDMQSGAGWKAVFGDVIHVDGRRIIPIASVQYLFGMGGGQGVRERGRAPGGGGGGGGMRVEPVALVEISDGKLRVEPVVNVTKLAIAAIILVGWSVFWLARMRRATATQA